MRYFVIFIFLVLSFSELSIAKEASSKKSTKSGWRESYGGDSAISDFKSIGYTVFSHVQDSFLNKNFRINQKKFLRTIKNSAVLCEKNLVLDGLKKDAINFPLNRPQLIKLDCEKFSKLSYNLKVKLVIHEYLPLNFIKDTDYFRSQLIESEFFKTLNVSIPDEDKIYNAITSCDVTFLELIRRDLPINLLKRFGGAIGPNSIELLVGAGCLKFLQILKDEGELQKEMYRESLELALMEYFYDNFLSESRRPYLEVPIEIRAIEFENLLSILDFNNDKKIIHQFFIPELDFINNLHHVKYDYGSDQRYKDPGFCKQGSTLLHIVAHFHRTTPSSRSYYERIFSWLESLGYLSITSNECGVSAGLVR